MSDEGERKKGEKKVALQALINSGKMKLESESILCDFHV